MPRKPSSAERPEKDDVFEIKNLIGYEKRGITEYFKVEWSGYPIEEATWEPVSNFGRPQMQIKKRMKELRKEAKALETTAASGDRKRFVEASPSKAASATKRLRTGEESPISPKLSSGRNAGEKKSLAVEEEEELEEEEEQEEESEEEEENDWEPPSSRGEPKIEVKVKSIRRSNGSDELEAVMYYSETPDKRLTLPVEKARRKYPQALIEFLLSRIQFKGFSTPGSP